MSEQESIERIRKALDKMVWMTMDFHLLRR